MTQEQIEAVKRELTAEIQHWQSLGPPMTRTEAHHQNSLATITALQARVDEAEARLEASQEALADQLEARTKAEDQAEKFKWQVRDTCTRAEKAEAEVARLTKDQTIHYDAAANAERKCERLRIDNEGLGRALSAQGARYAEELTQARADLATLRAAIAEAVRRADNPSRYAECFSFEAAKYITEPLRNLTKPDTPSERIMSDKDRENPVEGAHPTQPEGEDALVVNQENLPESRDSANKNGPQRCW